MNAFSALISVFIKFFSTFARSKIFAKSIAVFNVSVCYANNRRLMLLLINRHTNLYRNSSTKNAPKVAV